MTLLWPATTLLCEQQAPLVLKRRAARPGNSKTGKKEETAEWTRWLLSRIHDYIGLFLSLSSGRGFSLKDRERVIAEWPLRVGGCEWLSQVKSSQVPNWRLADYSRWVEACIQYGQIPIPAGERSLRGVVKIVPSTDLLPSSPVTK